MPVLETGGVEYIQRMSNADDRTFRPLRQNTAVQRFFSAAKPGGIPLRKNGQTGIRVKRGARSSLPVSGKDSRDIETRKAELRKAAQGFEAIFIRQLLKTMRSSVPGGGIYGGGTTGDIYADMVDNALSESMAARGSFGIADVLCRELTGRLDLETKSDSPQSAVETPTPEF